MQPSCSLEAEEVVDNLEAEEVLKVEANVIVLNVFEDLRLSSSLKSRPP